MKCESVSKCIAPEDFSTPLARQKKPAQMLTLFVAFVVQWPSGIVGRREVDARPRRCLSNRRRQRKMSSFSPRFFPVRVMRELG
jgi:hypothetical protein